jgi:hypothetical protein
MFAPLRLAGATALVAAFFNPQPAHANHVDLIVRHIASC